MTIAIFTGITSCSNNPIDKAMDAYEKVLTKWEKELDGQRLSFDKMEDFEKDLKALGVKEEDLENINEDDLTEKQKERAQKILERMEKLMTN